MSAIVTVMASLGCHAQLVIGNNGNAHFGDTTVVDTTATIHIAGYGANGSKGVIAFGNTNLGIAAVTVGEYDETGNHDTDKLWLHGRYGLVYSNYNEKDIALRHNPGTAIGFDFNAPVSGNAFYVASDPHRFAESTSVTTALGLLDGLSAISYKLDLPIPNEMGILGRDGFEGGPTSQLYYPDSLHYGLSLSSVQNILPQLVTTNADGQNYVDYNSLIPLLVVAVKELNAQVTQLTSRVEDLEDALGEGLDEAAPEDEGSSAADYTESEDIVGGLLNPALYQNIPNPFNADTQIRYCLPENVQQADLYVYDLQGKQVKRIAVTERGESSVTIQGNELQAGMYIYALIADGQEIDSKRMILTR